jgi:hypothetical protein
LEGPGPIKNVDSVLAKTASVRMILMKRDCSRCAGSAEICTYHILLQVDFHRSMTIQVQCRLE